jgi:hypothetical protein
VAQQTERHSAVHLPWARCFRASWRQVIDLFSVWMVGHVAHTERCVLNTKFSLELLTEGSLLEFVCLN